MPPLTLQLRQTAAALIPSLQATIILPWIVTTTSTEWNSQRTLWRMTREIRSDSWSSPLLYLRPRCKQNHQCPQQEHWNNTRKAFSFQTALSKSLHSTHTTHTFSLRIVYPITFAAGSLFSPSSSRRGTAVILNLFICVIYWGSFTITPLRPWDSMRMRYFSGSAADRR